MKTIKDGTYIISDFKGEYQEALVFKDGKRINYYDNEDRRKHARQIFKRKKVLIEDIEEKNAIHMALASYDCPPDTLVYRLV